MESAQLRLKEREERRVVFAKRLTEREWLLYHPKPERDNDVLEQLLATLRSGDIGSLSGGHLGARLLEICRARQELEKSEKQCLAASGRVHVILRSGSGSDSRRSTARGSTCSG